MLGYQVLRFLGELQDELQDCRLRYSVEGRLHIHLGKEKGWSWMREAGDEVLHMWMEITNRKQRTAQATGIVSLEILVLRYKQESDNRPFRS